MVAQVVPSQAVRKRVARRDAVMQPVVRDIIHDITQKAASVNSEHNTRGQNGEEGTHDDRRNDDVERGREDKAERVLWEFVVVAVKEVVRGVRPVGRRYGVEEEAVEDVLEEGPNEDTEPNVQRNAFDQGP
eukprot:TRINITY_DN8020_c0_g1_i2.p1 TRINITY_DN8020_c0_g1~~TRINITY_DN8020_c0_g1_i2.p1  ORF type:complete len:131 (+),score=17.05 TRINITY_DN8020_c0_g1_i2:1078-1470(+)